MHSFTSVLARGRTYQQGDTIDSANMAGVAMEGDVHLFEDLDPTDPVKRRSNKTVRCRLVRNTATIALLPRRAVIYQTGQYEKRVNGYCHLTAQHVAGIVDEFLPTTGVQVNDLFWIVEEGPTTSLSDLAASIDASIAEFGPVVALTAASSQATTAGRLGAQLLTGATQPLAEQIYNRVGRALSANTTNQTNRQMLINAYMSK